MDYNQAGINTAYLEAKKKFKPEDIENANRWADYWHDEVGAEVIPVDSARKGLWILKSYGQYYDTPVPEEVYKLWKDLGLFVYGIAVLCGELRRGKNVESFLNCIDYDNKAGRDFIVGCYGGVKDINDLAKTTVVENYAGAPEKGHIYIITKNRPLTNRYSDFNSTNNELLEKIDSSELLQIEIYGRDHAIICTNSYKKDSTDVLHRCKIVGTLEPLVLDAEGTDKSEINLDKQFKEIGLHYLDRANNGNADISLEDAFKDEFVIHEGENRQRLTLRVMESLLKRNKGILTLNKIKELSWEWNQKHCSPALDEKEFNVKWMYAIRYIATKEGQFTEEEQEIVKILDDLGIDPDRWLHKGDDEPDLLQVVNKLSKNLDFFDRISSSRYIDPATDEVMKDQHYKSFKDTNEVLFYNGKIYNLYGDVNIKQKLEAMRVQEESLLNWMQDLSDSLQEIIATRSKNKLQTSRFEEYQYALQKELYEQRRIQMVVRQNFRNEVIANVQVRTYINREMFNPDPSLLVLQNGVLNLKSEKMKVDQSDSEMEIETLRWELTPHSPDILSLNMLPVDYDPNATCPTFDRFLREITGQNKKLHINIQKMFGYCLYRSLDFQRAFMLYGNGDNGKSVILKVLEKFLGKENVSNVSLHDLCGDDKFYTAQLYGKMANLYADLPLTTIKDAGKFKAMTAGDTINAQNKNKPPFNFPPYAVQIYSTNLIPDCSDKSYGYYKRWILLHFEIAIAKEDI